MSSQDLAPRPGRAGVAIVWVLAVLLGVAAGLFAPHGQRALWAAVGMAVCLVAAFVLQLYTGVPKGFILRVGVSLLGAFVLLGAVTAGFSLAALAAS